MYTVFLAGKSATIRSYTVYGVCICFWSCLYMFLVMSLSTTFCDPEHEGLTCRFLAGVLANNLKQLYRMI